MAKRKAKANRQRGYAKSLYSKYQKCSNCGGAGFHYVPPSMGEPGFWICQLDEVTR